MLKPQLICLIAALLISACDNMRPEPVESNLADLSQAELSIKIDRSLQQLAYDEGQVGANLGRVGMRMELRSVQSYLEQLGYYEGPRLGILDATTVDAIDRYLENRVLHIGVSNTQ
jgi:peptidoglycan hydrolase-like protein with peptidoglycan-binding domain